MYNLQDHGLFREYDCIGSLVADTLNYTIELGENHITEKLVDGKWVQVGMVGLSSHRITNDQRVAPTTLDAAAPEDPDGLPAYDFVAYHLLATAGPMVEAYVQKRNAEQVAIATQARPLVAGRVAAPAPGLAPVEEQVAGAQ